MPTAIVKISEKANRVINIMKAKHDLRDKSQAINKIVEEYGKIILEPTLGAPKKQKHEFVKKYGINF